MTETVIIGRREVRVTSTDRVLFPDGTTKGDLIAYYRAIAPAILPHLRDRPAMLWRFPEGIDGYGFFQTQCRLPEWVRRVPAPFGRHEHYCVIEDEASLVAAANVSAIELHPLLWRTGDPERPTATVIDLDPGPPAGMTEVCRAALIARNVLRSARIKTSGRRGLHLFAEPAATFAEAKQRARAIAAELAEAHPDLFVDRVEARAREGRVFVDWAQNQQSRSLVAPYSVRAARTPRISTPVTWDEVERAARSSDEDALRFRPRDVLERVQRYGDLFTSAGTTG